MTQPERCFRKSGIRQDPALYQHYLHQLFLHQQYLLKNCSQIRKLISGMVAWGM